MESIFLALLASWANPFIKAAVIGAIRATHITAKTTFCVIERFLPNIEVNAIIMIIFKKYIVNLAGLGYSSEKTVKILIN